MNAPIKRPKTYKICTSRSAEIEVSVERRGRYPVLVETTQPPVAQIPQKTEHVFDSLFLSKDYVPKGTRSIKPQKMKFLRRGRTLSIILDEPIIHQGEEYFVIEVKGTGADTSRKGMVISLNHTKNLDPRIFYSAGIWGAVERKDAEEELENAKKLNEMGFPLTPHIGLNLITNEIVERIRRVSGGAKIEEIAQIVRIAKTNIRPKEVAINRIEELYREISLDDFVKIDSTVQIIQNRLMEEGKLIIFNGRAQDNRYLDGILTDAENLELVIPAYRMRDRNRISDDTISWLRDISEAMATEYEEKMRIASKS